MANSGWGNLAWFILGAGVTFGTIAFGAKCHGWGIEEERRRWLTDGTTQPSQKRIEVSTSKNKEA